MIDVSVCMMGGAALGGHWGPVGAIVGAAVGAAIGFFADRTRRGGPRLGG